MKSLLHSSLISQNKKQCQHHASSRHPPWETEREQGRVGVGGGKPRGQTKGLHNCLLLTSLDKAAYVAVSLSVLIHNIWPALPGRGRATKPKRKGGERKGKWGRSSPAHDSHSAQCIECKHFNSDPLLKGSSPAAAQTPLGVWRLEQNSHSGFSAPWSCVTCNTSKHSVQTYQPLVPFANIN